MLAGALVATGGGSARAAVSGLNRVTSNTFETSQSPKSATAFCASDQRVVGGGGEIILARAGDPRPVLTSLRPVRVRVNAEVTIEGYQAGAEEISPGTAVEWTLKTWAVCADALPGQHIVRASTPKTSSAKKAVAVACPPGERVIGSGGARHRRLSEARFRGRVHLQVARPSATGDIARAQAHEGVNGYPGKWWLTAYAICAPPPEGYQVVFSKSSAVASESEKIAGAAPGDLCPGATKLLSSGAAVSSAAPAHISLFSIVPSALGTIATAVESTPTTVNWNFVVATRVCAL